MRAAHWYRLSFPAVLLAFVLAGCGARRVPAEERALNSYRRRFGRVGVGVVGHAAFFGKVGGISSGSGFTFDVPPLLPISSAYCVLGAVAVATPFLLLEGALGGDGSFSGEVVEDVFEELAEDALTPEVLRHGLTDPERHYISDFSLDMSYAGTWHRDRVFGGDLEYSAFLLGVRFGGPRRYVPRYYVCGGFGWFDFDYDNRPDASVPGPYVGAGLEVFPRENLSLALDWRGHFFFGDDDAGAPVDGGASQTSLVFSWYW